ncbi:carboxypeptidase regulatory-like domain-containing protein, partial [bacterium]|nr:carboxypeptidase regulatory-like domain-containing protein [bacterium]
MNLRVNGLIAVSVAMVAGATSVACAPASVSPHPQTTADVPTASAYRLSGTVSFPERQTLVTGGAVIDRATVTLFDASNQAVAVGQTNAAGAFALDPGTGFAPTRRATYVLDAYKPIAANGVGADVARLRTVVSWTESGWTSVSGPIIVVNSLTTAVSVIQGLQAKSIRPQDTLETVSGASVTSPLSAIAEQWSAVNTMVLDLLARDQDPVARLSYNSGRYVVTPGAASVVKLERFDKGSFTDTAMDVTGTLQLAGPMPAPKNANSETAYFQVGGGANDGTGVVVSDGTYLYAKTWGDYAVTTANAQKWKKIGTGFNGTTRGTTYGTLGADTPQVLSAFYWNGGIYQTNNAPNQFLRIDTTTGAQSVVNLPFTTLDRAYGRPGIPHLLTSDGTYVYNLSTGIEARLNTDFNGFSVQVLNPATGFSLVRQFTMDTDSYYVDGVLCDGTYLYPIEWITTRPARVRRYRLSDGVREAEWTISQTFINSNYNAGANDPISGTWDWINKVFWIGNLTNDKIHLLRGGTYTHAGSYLSAPLDSGSGAPHYGRMNWTATTPAGTSLSFKVRS